MAALAGAVIVSATVGVVVGRATSSTATSTPTTVGSTIPTSAPPPSITATTAATTSTVTTSTTTLPVTIGPAGAFAGEWSVHVTVLAVDKSGYGILNWRTYHTCGQDPPPCDIFSGNDIIDGGNATFAFVATGPTTASGRVLTTTVPDVVPLGPFTARLDPVKDLLHLSVPLVATYPLCGTTARALSVSQQNAQGINCGA